MTSAEWRRAAAWYCRRLLGSRILPYISINLELRELARGDCGSISCIDWKKPRDFHVQLMTGCGKRKKQLKVLAHEMVHLKQIVRGELRLDQSRRLVWRGSDSTEDQWEDEAYGAEDELLRAYLSSL